MKLDFKPQNLINNLVIEKKTEAGIRRIFSTPKRTIDMTISPLNRYPKEYYVSSFNVYDNKSNLIKSMHRTVDENNKISTEVTKPKPQTPMMQHFCRINKANDSGISGHTKHETADFLNAQELSERLDENRPTSPAILYIQKIGTTGFEPATSTTPRQHATKLRHVPILYKY